MYYDDFKITECTANIDGKLVTFDAQATGSLAEAKNFYAKAFRYIGSTQQVFYNGHDGNDGQLRHIFLRK